jgi:hypothetical protein
MEPHLEEHTTIFAEINDEAAADGDAPALDEPEEGMEEMTAEVRPLVAFNRFASLRSSPHPKETHSSGGD